MNTAYATYHFPVTVSVKDGGELHSPAPMVTHASVQVPLPLAEDIEQICATRLAGKLGRYAMTVSALMEPLALRSVTLARRLGAPDEELIRLLPDDATARVGFEDNGEQFFLDEVRVHIENSRVRLLVTCRSATRTFYMANVAGPRIDR